MTTPDDVRRWREMAEAATPGPWRVGRKDESPYGQDMVVPDRPDGEWEYIVAEVYGNATANAVFIAESRTAIPGMARIIEAQEAENERLREALVALANAADLVSKEHAIVQPFLDVWKKHGAVIERARAALGRRL